MSKNIKHWPETGQFPGWDCSAEFYNIVDAMLDAPNHSWPDFIEPARQALQRAKHAVTIDDGELKQEIDAAAWHLSDPIACAGHLAAHRYISAEL